MEKDGTNFDEFWLIQIFTFKLKIVKYSALKTWRWFSKKYHFWNWFNCSHCTKSVWVLSSHIANLKVKPSENGISILKSTKRMLVLFRAKTVFGFFIDQIKWWSKCSLMFSRRLSQNSLSLPFSLSLSLSLSLSFYLSSQNSISIFSSQINLFLSLSLCLLKRLFFFYLSVSFSLIIDLFILTKNKH